MNWLYMEFLNISQIIDNKKKINLKISYSIKLFQLNQIYYIACQIDSKKIKNINIK